METYATDRPTEHAWENRAKCLPCNPMQASFLYLHMDVLIYVCVCVCVCWREFFASISVQFLLFAC